MPSMIIAARTGACFPLSVGDSFTVVNTTGGQVVDTWAVNLHDPTEYLSMSHTRTTLRRLTPRVGDALFSNRRRALLTMTEDSSPGMHDTLIAACDEERYKQLGVTGEHPSCAVNFRAALSELGIEAAAVPCPLNLFMCIPWDAEGNLEFRPVQASPGDHVTLRAEQEVVVVMSACPMDVNPINGGTPSDVEVRLHGGAYALG
ncbi:MAG: DUF1989 domain-containing protein [Streptosporangiales bacterium]|nr:DUF1989 domain-containing protein [Streptosporangiales bacterium]